MSHIHVEAVSDEELKGAVRTWDSIASSQEKNNLLKRSDKTKKKDFGFLGWRIVGKQIFGEMSR